MVLMSILREMGLSAVTGVDCVMVGLLETESMVNALFLVVKSGGLFCVYYCPSIQS